MSLIIQSQSEYSTSTSAKAIVAWPKPTQVKTVSAATIISVAQPHNPKKGSGRSIKDRIAAKSARDPAYQGRLDAARRLIAESFHVENQRTLASLRMSKGMTQAELAKQIGVKQPHIARIERGGAVLFSTAEKLADALNITLDNLRVLIGNNLLTQEVTTPKSNDQLIWTNKK